MKKTIKNLNEINLLKGIVMIQSEIKSVSVANHLLNDSV